MTSTINLETIMEINKILSRASMELTIVIGYPVELKLLNAIVAEDPEAKLKKKIEKQRDRLRKIDLIFSTVATHYMTTVLKIRSATRKTPIPDARKTIVKLLHDLIEDIDGYEVARLVGFNRCTAIYNKKEANNLILTNTRFHHNFGLILNRIKQEI